MKHMKNVFYLISMVLGLVGCKQPPPASVVPEQEAIPVMELQLTDAQIKNGNIEMSTVSRQKISSTIRLNGVIDVPPQNMVSITCPMGGYIKSINLLPGQEISKGEVLIVMEDPAFIQLQQDYLIGKSRIEYLQNESERQRLLAATEAASQKSYQQAKADFESQNIMLHALKEKLVLIGIDVQNLTVSNISRSISIRSPIHGFISKVSVNKGRYVSATETLAELVDPGDIHASLTVFEKDIAFIQKDQQVIVSLVARPEKLFAAEVLLVTRNIDENKSGMVHCHFHKYSAELVPGMAVSALIELEKRELPVVPEKAVLLWQGKHYVFLETGANKFELTQIQPGTMENKMIAITNSNIVWEGKRVVSNGAFSLLGILMKGAEEE
jgi:cobalt-zinc-cadmium efflux system membrane fusion protein